MIDNTSCWECCAVYPISFDMCPQCGSLNANTHMKEAVEQLNSRSTGSVHGTAGNPSVTPEKPALDEHCQPAVPNAAPLAHIAVHKYVDNGKNSCAVCGDAWLDSRHRLIDPKPAVAAPLTMPKEPLMVSAMSDTGALPDVVSYCRQLCAYAVQEYERAERLTELIHGAILSTTDSYTEEFLRTNCPLPKLESLSAQDVVTVEQIQQWKQEFGGSSEALKAERFTSLCNAALSGIAAKAELRAWLSLHGESQLGQMQQRAERAEAERDALREDAERFRAVREMFINGSAFVFSANASDTFGYACADSVEPETHADFERLADAYRLAGHEGVLAWMENKTHSKVIKELREAANRGHSAIDAARAGKE